MQKTLNKRVQIKKPKEVGPQIVDRAILPQVDIAESQLGKPDTGKTGQNQPRIGMFFIRHGDALQHPDQGCKNRIGDVKDPARKHEGKLHQKMGNQPAVDLLGVRCHGGKNVPHRANTLPGGEAVHIVKIVHQVRGQYVADQHPYKDERIDSQTPLVPGDCFLFNSHLLTSVLQHVQYLFSYF